MTVRRMQYAGSWYPSDPKEVESAIRAWNLPEERGKARAVIAPHAGWIFSGRIAARAVAALDPGAETVIIAGGHVPAGGPVLLANEDAFETPLGKLLNDNVMLDALISELRGDVVPRSDSQESNTVELMLPLVAHFFPKAKIISIRIPNDPRSGRIGAICANLAERLGRNAVLLASTDLTHYGPDYDFMPKGLGAQAARWVRDVNDASFINACIRMEAEQCIKIGEGSFAACSSGAAAGAIGFALEKGVRTAQLLEYGTSLDLRPNSSFVGYAAVAFS